MCPTNVYDVINTGMVGVVAVVCFALFVWGLK